MAKYFRLDKRNHFNILITETFIGESWKESRDFSFSASFNILMKTIFFVV